MKLELNYFNTEHLYTASQRLLADLGITLYSDMKQNRVTFDNIYFSEIKNIYFSGMILEISGQKIEQDKYDNLLFYSFELSRKPNRSFIAELCRKCNISEKGKDRPIALIIKYGNYISLALPERFLYKQEWRQGEKVGKVIILRDINTQKTHEGHRRILQDLSNHNAKNFNELHKAWLKVLNIQTLNKNFYERLVKWYELCFNDIKIDLRAASRVLNKKIDDELKPQAVIRVIVRMMFIWFMKEKGLIPDTFFKKEFAKQFLKSENTYYNAILQNLFFAALNKKIDERRFRKHNPQNRYDAESNDYGISDVFRYKDFFKDESKANEFVNQTKTIPFINGGLFQCHDYKFAGKDTTNNEKNTANNYIIDGFSDNKGEMAKISDSVIFELIDLFNDYVWTIEESTPTEQDIALDPELLGTIFENLIGFYNPETKENARKQTGSFYTPREIVEYMCTESLKEALKTKFPNLHAQIDDLIEKSEDQLNFPDKTKMLAAITDLKILDPACGSGAFPMGMFMLMVRTIEKLQEHKTTYRNKLDIITNCIYGIDIQNIAIEISKLRFFISLLVDYQTPEHIEDFEVLPNLETKFVVANTLIDIDLKKSKNPLFEQELLNKCDELTKIFIPFTQAKTPKEKTDIKNAFSEKKQELSALLKENNFGGDDVNKIVEWNPFNVCYCSPFFDKTIMFGLKDGFDVVIGNPPWIQSKILSTEIKQTYKSLFKTAVGQYDLFNLFIEKGHDLLRKHGNLIFITPDRFITNIDYTNVRDYLLNNCNLMEITSLGDDIFNNVDMPSAIIHFKNSKEKNEKVKCRAYFSNEFSFKNQVQFTENQNFIFNIFGNNQIDLILKSISSKSDILQIHLTNTRGVEVGKKSEIIHSNYQDGFKKFLRGGDIERYCIKNSVFIDTSYSGIDYKDDTLYQGSKILIRKTGNGIIAVVDEEYRYVIQTIYIFKIKPTSILNEKYILGCLNSKLMEFWYNYTFGEKDRKVFPHLTQGKVLAFPIMNITLEQQQSIIALVNQILSAKKENPETDTTELEQKIDKLVYELYGLTEEEIKVIEGK